jgi:hypothetical protein
MGFAFARWQAVFDRTGCVVIDRQVAWNLSKRTI